MRGERIFSLVVIGIFLISFISAECTITFDKSDYVATETVTAALVCDAPQEKSLSYTLNWTNSSGALIEQDTGTTPATKSEFFYEDYILPSTYLGAINASLSGAQLEGVDTANVTALSAGENSNILVIANVTIGGKFIGTASSIKGIVKDENGLKISGGSCKLSVWSNDETTMTQSRESAIFDGEIKDDWMMHIENFAENTDYAVKILCYCGSLGSGTECIDENGANVNNSIGSTKAAFMTNIWLSTSTSTKSSTMEIKEMNTISVNVINHLTNRRIPLKITFDCRIDEGDNSSQRIRSPFYFPECDTYGQCTIERGISANTTQQQGIDFLIKEHPYIEGRITKSYCSSYVNIENILEGGWAYTTTSSAFNITSTELNLEPDWQWLSATRLNSVVNLSDSSFNDYNGTGTGNVDLKLHVKSGELDILHAIEVFNSIANITITNLTSNFTRHIDYELEFTDEDNVEIELRNVDLSKTSGVGWWNITLDFYDLDLRQTVALEGVENKTGTFHLDVNCPSTADIGSDINCSITAQVEDAQVVEKEVDFTCYITDGVNQFSSLNYNQMINQTALTLYKEFLVPSTFLSSTQYVLQCHADYYNLGSRRDSFYDTFTTSDTTSTSGGSSRSGDGGAILSTGIPITGGAIDEKGKPIDWKDIPFIPEEKRKIGKK